MEITESSIPDVKLIQPNVFGDERGFFLELYHQGTFRDAGLQAEFVQDNLSRSQQGVLRGLHFQIQHPQGKLVSVLSGAVFDVAVDVRKSSPTFGRWVGQVLSAENRCSMYIPEGFAHGFQVLSESADFFYKCTDLYHPEFERTLLWNDPDIGIDWRLDQPPTLSEKDIAGVPLSQLECFD